MGDGLPKEDILDIALYVIVTLIAVLALGMLALIAALTVALVIRFKENREENRPDEQKTIPPPVRRRFEPPPIPSDHARVMIRPRQPTLKELEQHRAAPPMFRPEPAAVTPEIPPARADEDASEPSTDGNNAQGGKWDEDPTEETGSSNLTLLSELTNPPTPSRIEVPKPRTRRSMFGRLFKGNRTD